MSDTIEHLVGIQAQNPLDPYYGLWARLEPFDPAQLSGLIDDHKAVRTAFLRATIHLVTAADCLDLDATTRPVSARTFGSTSYSKNTAGMDVGQFLTRGRQLLEARPMGRAELGRVLAEQWPDRDPQSMTYAGVLSPPSGPGSTTWGVESERTRNLDHGRELAGDEAET
ncbi:MAG TPA: crosslink repair DNA glycosylase YcaQ family protein [Acidimicrobiia bacterium]